MLGAGGNFLQSNSLVTDARVGAAILGSGAPLGPAGPISCLTGDAGFCIRSAKDDDTFGFTTAAGNLSPFLLAGGVDAAIGSRLHLLGIVLGDTITSSATASSIDWDGELRLTYTYATGPAGPGPTPAPAPEPSAWALMIAGFGLAGVAIRRRQLRPATRR